MDEYINMKWLTQSFNEAKQLNIKYVGVKVRMEGFQDDEIIVNTYNNIDSKLEYYKKTYDESLNHKFAPGIKIVGFGYANSLAGIELNLL